jgi:diguanylate cyclase (GGDEF)-like protein/PAS domain S-box-containing protein
MQLNRKILLIIIGILALSLFGSSIINQQNFRRNYTDALVTGSFGIAHSIKSIVNELLFLGLPLESLSGMDKKLSEVVNMNEHIIYAAIIDPNGKVLFHNQANLIGKYVDDEVSIRTLNIDQDTWQLYDRFDGHTYYDVATPLFSGSTRIGVIRLGFPTSVIEEKMLEGIQQLTLNMFVTFILIALLLNLFLRKQVVDPIIQLAKYAESISEGEYRTSLNLNNNDEIGRLSDSLQHMGKRLEAQIDELKRSGLELEQKVENRTHELADTNQTLQISNAHLKQVLQRERSLTIALRKSQEQFRILFEDSKAIMMIIDPESGSIVDANKAAATYYGYSEDALLKMKINEINTLSDKQIDHEMKRAREEKRSHFYFRHQLASGEIRDVEVHSGPIDWAGKTVLYSIIHDVTDRKRAEAELDHIAHYDALTGLPNRLLKTDRLRQAIARSRRSNLSIAVCYLDLDGFKPINDTYGHSIGDQILIEVAQRLLSTVREGDTVSRIGGDEFVLILSDLLNLDQCKRILDRIMTVICDPLTIGDDDVEVSASIGITLFPEDDADADILLRHADQAMYIAKEKGKNRYHLFDPIEDKQVKAHQEVLQLLEYGITHNHLVLHYQPKVDMFDCRVIGLEALVRWRHPDRGLLYPADFLHLVSNTDIEILLGNWVIENALNQLKQLSEQGLSLSISINISVNHLQQPSFATHLQQTLSRYPELKPGDLEFEILESASIDDINQIFHTLVNCRELGIKFSLDDFGTGYSSLAYFHRLPVDLLKIDKTFVRNMLEDPQDLTIVDSVVKLASAFDHPVIAEGVESLEHGAALLRLGCRLGQGYGIARPMKAEEIPEWLEKWSHNREWQTLNQRLYVTDSIDIYASIASHKRWISKLIDQIRAGESISHPQVDSKHCTFGRWLHGAGYVNYGHLNIYDDICDQHEKIHQLGAAIAISVDQDNKDQVEQKIKELLQTSSDFITTLEELNSTAMSNDKKIAKNRLVSVQ